MPDSPEIPRGSYHDDPRIQAELNMRAARSRQSSPHSMNSPRMGGMGGYGGSPNTGRSPLHANPYGGSPLMGNSPLGAHGGMEPEMVNMGMQGSPRGMNGLSGMGGYGNSGSQLLMPQSMGNSGMERRNSPLSALSDDDLEAEIARLKGGSGNDEEDDEEPKKRSGGRPNDDYSYAGYGGQFGGLPGGLSASSFGGNLGRDLEHNPVFSGSHPGLYPVEEMKPDSSHRLPFEGGGMGLENSLMGGISLPGSGLPSQSALAHGDLDDLDSAERELDAMKNRREALEKYLG